VSSAPLTDLAPVEWLDGLSGTCSIATGWMVEEAAQRGRGHGRGRRGQRAEGIGALSRGSRCALGGRTIPYAEYKDNQALDRLKLPQTAHPRLSHLHPRFPFLCSVRYSSKPEEMANHNHIWVAGDDDVIPWSIPASAHPNTNHPSNNSGRSPWSSDFVADGRPVTSGPSPTVHSRVC
jgi:hypothetical protein